ncbi:Uma2 family endonuclease [Chamaesiphon sp. VAR_48_metabat_403]|uniref:Uma2 family endonuclease n=1 Tax=Chamaesiphon sp. VAR_48_metabat_403 TaxID=2964700 RepID=UPI00286E02AE|nr:Uma2 family endonuclease [Chamaesiphon sp. VAR_48_metabat_403]
MNVAQSLAEETVAVNIHSADLHVTPAQFDRLCADNRDLRLELTKEGKLIVMAPTFGESGKRNLSLAIQVGNWNERTELGEAFDSSTGYDFTAIGGGKMSPDVSWIEKSRLDGVSLRQFIPVVPDFLVELRSTTDRLSDLQSKMQEYQRLGVKLGLLINPQDKQVEIYRLGRETEVLQSPNEIDCQDVMPGFNLDLTRIL